MPTRLAVETSQRQRKILPPGVGHECGFELDFEGERLAIICALDAIDRAQWYLRRVRTDSVLPTESRARTLSIALLKGKGELFKNFQIPALNLFSNSPNLGHVNGSRKAWSTGQISQLV